MLLTKSGQNQNIYQNLYYTSHHLSSQQVKQCPLCHNVHNACSCKTKILTKHRSTMSYQDAQFPLNRDKLTSQIWRVILIEILNARMPLCSPPLPPGGGQWPIKVNDNSFVTSLARFNNQSPLPSQSQHLMSSSRQDISEAAEIRNKIDKKLIFLLSPTWFPEPEEGCKSWRLTEQEQSYIRCRYRSNQSVEVKRVHCSYSASLRAH